MNSENKYLFWKEIASIYIINTYISNKVLGISKSLFTHEVYCSFHKEHKQDPVWLVCLHASQNQSQYSIFVNIKQRYTWEFLPRVSCIDFTIYY